MKTDQTSAHKEPAKVDIEEEMVALYHTIERALSGIPQPVLQFISSHHREGVSTIAREFAAVAANVFGRAVLVLDISKGKFLHNSAEPSHLVKQPDGKFTTSLEKSTNKPIELDSLLSHKLYDNRGFHVSILAEHNTGVSALLSDKYFRNLKALFKEQYDFIIIDSPPASNSSIGLAAAGKANGTILVVEAEATRWPVVARVKERLEKVGGKVVGVILNKQKHYIPAYIYRHFL